MKKKFNEKQLHILDVAEKLIARKGFEGTSVRDISSTANINVAMISYYFGSKEKMMAYLYRYRVQKIRENFTEFAISIRDIKPEVQMKDLLKFIIHQLFSHNYFHGYVTLEMRHTEHLKDDLLDFYNAFTVKVDEVIKKGVVTGVFTQAPKAEDILTLVVGSTLFVIRNKNFYEIYITGESENYLDEAEKKVQKNMLVTVFSLLGFQP